MIFKIVGNFDEVDFEKMLNKLTSIFEFIYCDESLFVALRKWSDRELIDKTLKDKDKLNDIKNNLKKIGINDSSTRIYNILKDLIINDRKFY